MSDQKESIIRVSVSEAAQLFGVSTKTIRQALKADELRYIVVRGRYKINFISLVEWSQKSTRRSNLLKNQGLGQYVNQWKISNKKYSPNPKSIRLVE
ncbi:helix-turn-helix domain-containing protein [bacterium]|jgi:excisionase family DNA binding protein|nr:helix-turn-helix domain-containing protein [bacterium]MBT4649502.1 helix-turn-helix domain-containing protein [bacterium]